MRRERMLMEEMRTVKRQAPRSPLARDLAALERAAHAYREARAERLRVEAQFAKASQSGAC
jgi:hypothetical protein